MALLLQIYHDALQWHDTLCCVHGLTVCDFAAPPDMVSPNFATVRMRVEKEGERTPSELAWIPFRSSWFIQNILLSYRYIWNSSQYVEIRLKIQTPKCRHLRPSACARKYHYHALHTIHGCAVHLCVNSGKRSFPTFWAQVYQSTVLSP